MKQFSIQILTALIITSSLSAQTFDPFIQDKVDQLSYDSLLLNLQDFESLGIKNIYSEELKETAQWIINKYEYWGYDNIQMDTFYLNGQMLYNIVITKEGTLFPDQFVIIDGHYDTYMGPGVNDNGTGTAIVLEIARMMKDMQTDYSVKFIHFSAEEMGLIGSSHYVSNTVVPEDLDIRLVFNIDEVGGVAGEVNNILTCERDEAFPNSNNAESSAFTDTLATLTEMYSELFANISHAYGSDYVPFMSAGYVVTGLYEYNESPYPHSIHDSLSNIDMDYVFEVTKSSLAASLYFTGANDTNTGFLAISDRKENFNVYPNPFEDYFSVKNSFGQPMTLSLYDVEGRLLEKINLSGKSTNRVKPLHGKVMFFYILSDENGNHFDSGKLIRL